MFVQRLHFLGHLFLMLGEILQSQGVIPSQFIVSSQEHTPHFLGQDSLNEGNLLQASYVNSWQKY